MKSVTCSRDSAAVAYMWPPSSSSCQLGPGASWQAATATAVPHMRGEGREVHLDAEAAVWVTSVSRGGH